MTTNSKEYARAYYQAHKEQIKAYQRNYLKKKKTWRVISAPTLFDSERYKETIKASFDDIPKQTYSQQYYAANRERIRAQQKESRAKKKRLQKQRDYYAANRERITAQQRAYHQKKAKEKRMAKTWYGRIALRFKSLFK